LYDRQPGQRVRKVGAVTIARLEQLFSFGCKKRSNRKMASIATSRRFRNPVTGVLVLSLTLTLAQQVLPVLAQSEEHAAPAGTLLLPLTPKLESPEETPSALAPLPKKARQPVTLLLPLTPKLDAGLIDDGAAAKKAGKTKRNAPQSSSSATLRAIESSTNQTPQLNSGPSSPVPPVEPPANPDRDIAKKLKTPSNAGSSDPDEPDISKIEEAEENNPLLKGTVQIVADDTEYDQLKNTFLGTGSAVATIAGQDSRLEADMILYDQNTEMLDARGNVKIIRQGQVSTGSSFKFKVSSDEYLITNPDTAVNNTEVVARTGYGSKSGIRFREGNMQMATPVHFSRNLFNGTLGSAYDSFYRNLHPEAYVNDKPSFTFRARKMTYEKYKETGNLTVFGGKLMFGQFGVPLGKFTATVAQGEQGRLCFPVVPFFSNNLMVGGANIGPMFNHMLPGNRTFSWAPLVQYGGRIDGTEGKNIGAGFRLSYHDPKLSGNLAYGSVSNLLVGDLRYRFNERDSFQSGINRYLPAGLFGVQRARAIAELVDMRGVGNIPFLQGVAVRSSLAAASDNPSLLNQTPQYKQLFTVNHGNIVNGFRWQEQIMTTTHPLLAFGNQKYGATTNIFGGVSGAAYSSGSHMAMGEIGPVVNVYFNRLRLMASTLKAGVNGQSPFVFDQYIQGATSSQLGGSLKVCKYLDLGGNLGYNWTNKMAYQKSICAAIGPDDFKFLISHDTIRGIQRYGFDFFYGQPIAFNKLIMKGVADQGQLGN
jgi:hypothetical protein